MFHERKPLSSNQTFNNFNNLPGRKEQPYISWKYKDNYNKNKFNSVYEATNNKPKNMGVPTNSKPPLSFEQLENVKSKNFINQRRPIASKYNARAKPNPIKHWRKQLLPYNGVVSSKVTIRQAIDIPGGLSLMTKSNLECTNKPHSIKNYLIKNDVNKDCKQECETYTFQDINGDEIIRKVPLYDNTRITRPASTVVKKTYYQTNAAYLRSRVKLYNQNQKISPITNIEYFEPSNEEPKTFIQPSDSDTGSQNFNSVYCNNVKCNNDNTKNRKNRVIYKPNNFTFSNQGAVSSSLRILNIKKNEINTSAFNLKDSFGSYTANNSRYRGLDREPITTKTFYHDPKNKTNCTINKTITNRMPAGGKGYHTVCEYTPTHLISGRLGGILQRTRGPGIGSLVRIADCRLFKDACCDKNRICSVRTRRWRLSCVCKGDNVQTASVPEDSQGEQDDSGQILNIKEEYRIPWNGPPKISVDRLQNIFND